MKIFGVLTGCVLLGGFSIAHAAGAKQCLNINDCYSSASSSITSEQYSEYDHYADNNRNYYPNKTYKPKKKIYNGYKRGSYKRGRSYRKNSSSSRRGLFRSSRSSSRFGRSALPRQIPAPGVKTFVFSPRHRAWAAYSASGERLASGKANGGANYCRDLGRSCRTPIGTFRVYSKGSYGCKSSKYPLPRGGAPMPYCMFFRGGYAIHGSPHISNNNSSHGCIRVKTSAAAWLHSSFITPGTRVKVLPY